MYHFTAEGQSAKQTSQVNTTDKLLFCYSATQRLVSLTLPGKSEAVAPDLATNAQKIETSFLFKLHLKVQIHLMTHFTLLNQSYVDKIPVLDVF